MITPDSFPDPTLDVSASEADVSTVAVLAGGCFWCVEAVYKQLEGVSEVTSGYAGGAKDTADYHTVSSGVTDHVEAVRIRFEPAKTSYGQLLKVFFSIAHDPTQRDRQGPDVGRQYRSVIFYADELQKRVAEAYIDQLAKARIFGATIVTEVRQLDAFYEAEPYHQNYAELNAQNPYIQFNALPKVKKVRTYFAGRVKQR